MAPAPGDARWRTVRCIPRSDRRGEHLIAFVPDAILITGRAPPQRSQQHACYCRSLHVLPLHRRTGPSPGARARVQLLPSVVRRYLVGTDTTQSFVKLGTLCRGSPSRFWRAWRAVMDESKQIKHRGREGWGSWRTFLLPPSSFGALSESGEKQRSPRPVRFCGP